MLQTTISARIAYGLARAASIVGADHMLYRPTTADRPVAGSPFGTIFCAFDVKPDFRFVSTAQPTHSYAALLADPSLVRQGDYLVGDEIHFIARIEPLRPALCVLCDQTLDILTTAVATSAGTNGYGGRTSDTDAVVAQGWPVSMSVRSRAGQDVTKLPSDTRAAYYDVLAPPIPRVVLTFGMRVRDPAGQSYQIVSAELSPFGWKLVAGLATT
ncbi:hypothetical protein HN018_10840 [Lichenicola cladoniae]|uniref:Uncharacterized protein n=1 Tax=Lichenicola cladoniae TaxID=1484109 RepID=A0A6M8HPW8_9PROT|nr:hypothetical protein [Lichenicola cladoniae]NPD67863.1 hypothetical protein [Acetobacteraceae bacterium]QKE90464.1 hypothetical protein HN018_10840 [Lichenicola cladoniae]